jgi:hypothetical protein
MASIECDPNQSVASALYLAARTIAKAADFPLTTSWSFVYRGIVVPNDTLLSEFFRETESPTVILRFEYPAATPDPSAPVFTSTIADGVAKSNTGVIPAFITAMLNHIAAKRDLEGIYRKSGLQTNTDAIINFIDRTVDPVATVEFIADQAGHDVACALKQYIRTLSVPIVPPELARTFIEALSVPNARHTLDLLKIAVACLPTLHHEFLRTFCEHLAYVEAGDNQMTFGSFALVMGGNFFRPTPGGDVIHEMVQYQEVMRLVFQHWRYIFLNEPLVMEQKYATLKADVQLVKTIVRAGERLRVLEAVGSDQVRLEYNGQPLVALATDIEPVPDDDSPPAFWNLIGEARSDFLNPQLLDPDAMGAEDAARLEACVQQDLAEIARANTALGRIRKSKTIAKSERVAERKRILAHVSLF